MQRGRHHRHPRFRSSSHDPATHARNGRTRGQRDRPRHLGDRRAVLGRRRSRTPARLRRGRRRRVDPRDRGGARVRYHAVRHGRGVRDRAQRARARSGPARPPRGCLDRDEVRGVFQRGRTGGPPARPESERRRAGLRGGAETAWGRRDRPLPAAHLGLRAGGGARDPRRARSARRARADPRVCLEHRRSRTRGAVRRRRALRGRAARPARARRRSRDDRPVRAARPREPQPLAARDGAPDGQVRFRLVAPVRRRARPQPGLADLLHRRSPITAVARSPSCARSSPRTATRSDRRRSPGSSRAARTRSRSRARARPHRCARTPQCSSSGPSPRSRWNRSPGCSPSADAEAERVRAASGRPDGDGVAAGLERRRQRDAVASGVRRERPPVDDLLAARERDRHLRST